MSRLKFFTVLASLTYTTFALYFAWYHSNWGFWTLITLLIFISSATIYTRITIMNRHRELSQLAHDAIIKEIGEDKFNAAMNKFFGDPPK